LLVAKYCVSPPNRPASR